MPDHITHRIVKDILLGRREMDVDKIIDDPVRFLGKGHRKFLHSPRDIMLLAAFSKDPASFMEKAFLNLSLDQTTSMRRKLINKINPKIRI